MRDITCKIEYNAYFTFFYPGFIFSADFFAWKNKNVLMS